MELYIAIPKAITDVYWNESTETSKALGMFCVKPEFKKNMFGKITVTGFKEVITGEKIANRIPIVDIYGVVYKYEDEDCKIGKNPQIGDIAWEIIDKSTADRFLTPEELQKYMSLSPEEVHKQLQNIRTKAISVGQECSNLEMKHRFRRANMNSNEFYVAIPKAITDIYSNGLTEASEALGMFFVKPEIKKGMFGKLTVTGFKEAITGEKIANRIPLETDYGVVYDYYDKDCMIGKDAQIGDVEWEIIDKSTADRLFPPEELQRYLSLSPEEVHEQLQSIHTKAISVGQTSGKGTGRRH